MDNTLKARFALVKRISPLELSSIHTKELDIYKDNIQKIENKSYEYHEYWWFLYGLNEMQRLVKTYGGFWPKTVDVSQREKILDIFYQRLYSNIDKFYDTIKSIDLIADIDTIHDLEDLIQSKIEIDIHSTGSKSLLERIDAHTKHVKKAANTSGGQADELVYPT